MTPQQEFMAKPEIKALPEAIQMKLDSFIFKEIPEVPFFKPDGKPKEEWKMFYARTWNIARGAAWFAAEVEGHGEAYNAAWNAARDASRGAARGAAWGKARDAAWSAAWDAAQKVAWRRAGDAALDASWDAAQKVAWRRAGDAARDADLYTYYILTSDLKVKDLEKHLNHVKARWEVWQKGYGLLYDVDGVLYVYSKSP